MVNVFIILLTTLVLLTEVDAADKVRISISDLSDQFMTYPLAHRRGFVKEEGIEAEIIRVTGGAASAAMSSGDLDYGTGMAVGGAITGPLPVKVVACFVPAPVFALVSRPEVKSVQELKDKTVGISTFSGLSIFGGRVIAKHFGLDPDKDLKFVAISDHALDFIWFRLDFFDRVYNEDPSVCEKGLRVMIEERKQTLKITRDVPLGEVADLSLIREAQREMGTK